MREDAADIAIVTPSLDQAAFLGQAIESVLAQREVHVEHVVVDGGSHDRSVAVLERAGSSGVRWVSEPDRGQSHAFNKGLAMTTAPIVGWLNADDEYAPNALATVVARFAAAPSVDVIYGDAEQIDAHGRVIRHVRSHGFDERSLLLQRFALYHPTFFYRRAVFDRIGPVAEDLHLVMDFDLALRIARRCRVSKIDAVLARHRVHAAAKSVRSPERFAAEYLAVLDRVFGDPAVVPDLRGVRGEAYQAVHLQAAVQALRTDDRRAARGHLARALAVRRALDARTIKVLLLSLDAATGARLGRAVVRGLGGQA